MLGLGALPCACTPHSWSEVAKSSESSSTGGEVTWLFGMNVSGFVGESPVTDGVHSRWTCGLVVSWVVDIVVAKAVNGWCAGLHWGSTSLKQKESKDQPDVLT